MCCPALQLVFLLLLLSLLIVEVFALCLSLLNFTNPYVSAVRSKTYCTDHDLVKHHLGTILTMVLAYLLAIIAGFR